MQGLLKELKAASSSATRAETALPDGGVLSSPFGEVDLSKHRDAAHQIWTMLDEMSDKDPESYNKFIRQHLEDAMTEKTGRRTVTPDAGACFKTTILRARPVKRDGVGDVRGSEIFPFPVLPDDVASGQPLYVNLCSHSKLAVPKMPDGKSVLEAKGPRGGKREPADWSLADLLMLEIPLSVGNVRPVKGTARTEWAVDVLLHPWAVAVFEEHKGFPANFVRFLAQVMEEELGMAFDPTPGEGGVIEPPAAPGPKTVLAAAAGPAPDIGLSEARTTSSRGKSSSSTAASAAAAASERGWRLCRATYMGGDMVPGSTKQTCVPFTVAIRVGSPAEEALRGRKGGAGAASGDSGSAGSGSASGGAGGKGGAGAGNADVLASPAALLHAKASEFSAAGASAVATQPKIVLPGTAAAASGRAPAGSATGAGKAAAAAAAAAAKPSKPSAPATKEEKEAAAAAVASVAAAAAAIRSAPKVAAPLVQELDAPSSSGMSDAASSAGAAAAADEPRHLSLAIGGSARCALGTASLQPGDGDAGALVLTLVFDAAAVDVSQLRMQHVDLEVAPDAAKFTVDPAVLLAAASTGDGSYSGTGTGTTALFALPVSVDPAAVGAKYSKKSATLTMTLQRA